MVGDSLGVRAQVFLGKVLEPQVAPVVSIGAWVCVNVRKCVGMDIWMLSECMCVHDCVNVTCSKKALWLFNWVERHYISASLFTNHERY